MICGILRTILSTTSQDHSGTAGCGLRWRPRQRGMPLSEHSPACQYFTGCLGVHTMYELSGLDTVLNPGLTQRTIGNVLAAVTRLAWCWREACARNGIATPAIGVQGCRARQRSPRILVPISVLVQGLLALIALRSFAFFVQPLLVQASAILGPRLKPPLGPLGAYPCKRLL